MENSFYVQRVFSSFTNRSCQKNTSSARFCSRAFTGGSPRTYLIQVSSSGKGTSSHQICKPRLLCQTSALQFVRAWWLGRSSELRTHQAKAYLRGDELTAWINMCVCFIPIQKRETPLTFCQNGNNVTRTNVFANSLKLFQWFSRQGTNGGEHADPAVFQLHCPSAVEVLLGAVTTAVASGHISTFSHLPNLRYVVPQLHRLSSPRVCFWWLRGSNFRHRIIFVLYDSRE